MASMKTGSRFTIIAGSPVSLLGWYLTDDANQPRKWALPGRTLNAGAYLLVFASNKDRKPASGNLHTNFKLETSPDYLALTHDIAGGGVEVVTEFNTYPQQAPDLSYGLASTTLSTLLVGAAAPVKVHIPASSALGTTWLGGTANEPFDDAGWLSGTTGVGFGDHSSIVGAGESQTTAQFGYQRRDCQRHLGRITSRHEQRRGLDRQQYRHCAHAENAGRADAVCGG